MADEEEAGYRWLNQYEKTWLVYNKEKNIPRIVDTGVYLIFLPRY